MKTGDMYLQHHVQVGLSRRRGLHRRDFLRGISAASVAAGTLSWTDLFSVQADELRKQGMACILLWMQGGPSQFETFSPKPGHDNGGETTAISTSLPGIQIADRFPHVAQVMDDVAILRSMTSREGNHQRASFLIHTGYAPTASVKHPALGSIAAHQIQNAACELPAFVRIGNRFRNCGEGGLLGVDFNPFQIATATRPPENTQLTTNPVRYQRRLGLLGRLEQSNGNVQSLVSDHDKLYARATRMILSPQMDAFDLEQESSRSPTHGEGEFADACVLARRLVESGVTFIEVSSPGGWDTHYDVFPQTKNLAEQVDQPVAALISDLKERGLLDRTLVVWMGEFGRTPRINARAGRDHYPRAFNVLLAGGGVRGGQVIGETDAGGTEVTERPVTIPDLMRSMCAALKIDADHENMLPIGRPIRVVDGGQVVSELFA